MTSSTLLADPPSNETIDVFYIKISSVFTKILLVVAQLFRAHGRDHAESRYLLCTTVPWAEFEPSILVSERPLCLLAHKTRIESSGVESTVAHSDATRFDSTIQCDADTALLEFCAKQTVCCSSISVSWSEVNATSLVSTDMSAA